MESLFSLALFAIVGCSFALLCLALNNQILNAVLILSPAVITALYGPLTGQSPGLLATAGSVLDRIMYMLIFGAPFFIGYLGALNRRKLEGKVPKRLTPIPPRVLIGSVFLVSVLKIFSILGLKPVEGQGQSIYVPIFASILSVVSILILASSLFTLHEVRKAFELIIFGLFLFLLLNCFLQIATWAPQIEIFQSAQTDGFRYSPFAQVLQLTGRQAFFDTDPQSFAVYSLLAFSTLICSENRFMRFIGPLVVFVVGSTTQSRLFYIVVAIVFVLSLLLSRSNQFSRILKQAILLLLFFLYYYFLILNENNNSNSGIQSFSGRTGIWKVVLEHWSDRGLILGNQGVYSLKDYSSEIGGRFIFFHSHNLVLQYLWDWGLFGLVLALAFCLAIFLMSTSLSKSGYLLAFAIIMGGVIEITLPNTLLSSKFIFVLLLVKNASSSREPEKSAR